MYGWFGGMHLYGGLLMLLTWAAVMVLAVWVVRALFPAERSSEHEAALALLNRRYNAGEISAAEYEQARHALDG
jgi:uncharacterized membrane protein